MKRAYDANVKKLSFLVGHFVWYVSPRTLIEHTSKWQRFYIGTYQIERVINYVNYVIRRTPRARPVTTYVDKPKLFHGSDPQGWGGVGGRQDSDVIAPPELVRLPAGARGSGATKRDGMPSRFRYCFR